MLALCSRPRAHPGQPLRQTRLKRELQPALARDRALWQFDRQRQGLDQLRERRLLHCDWHSWHQPLGHLDRILRAARHVFRTDLPHDRLRWVDCRQRRCGDIPAQLSGLVGRNRHRLGRKIDTATARSDAQVHRAFGRIAQRELCGVAVLRPYERRQPADDLQILGRLNARFARAKQPQRHIGDRDNLKGRQRIVQWHRHPRLALVVQQDPAVPEQQCVEQLARGSTAAAAARRHRLTPVMAAPDDLHLGRRRGNAPGALL